MIVDCNASKFRGLKNPYTGEEMRVKMLVQANGSPLFFCPDTYSTATRFRTAAEALDAWERQNGISGIKPRTPVRCAYTGEDLRIAEDCVGFYLEGGFDPHRLMSDDEFVYYANMRDGRSTVDRPVVGSRVSYVEPVERVTVTTDDSGPDSDMMKVAEDTVSQFKDSLGMKKNVTVNGVCLKGKRRK